MARLIGAEDLGQRRTPRPQSGTVGYRAGIAESAAAQTGSDIAASGQDLQRTGINVIATQRDAQNRQELASARSAFAKQQIETEQGFQKDQDYTTFKPRYDEAMKKTLGDVSATISDPVQRQTFIDEAGVDIAQGQGRMGQRAYALETDAQRGHLTELYAQNLDTALKAPDQATRDKIFKATLDSAAAARDGGWITPVEYSNQTRAFATDYAKALYSNMSPSERLAALIPGGHGPNSTSGDPSAAAGSKTAIKAEPLLPPDVNKAIDRAAHSPQDADVLKRIAAIESNGDTAAKNPKNPDVLGTFQISTATAKQYGVTDRADPEQAAQGAAALLADNRRALQASLGRDPTAAELYLAHQQGATGAAALLANPGVSALAVLTAVYGDPDQAKAAIVDNGGHADMTAGQFSTLWTERFDGRKGSSGGPVTLTDSLAPPPGGYDFSQKSGTPVDLIPVADRLKMIEQAQADVKDEANRARVQLQASVEVGFDDQKQNAFLTGQSDPTFRAQVMAAYPDERGMAKIHEIDRQAEMGHVNKLVKVNGADDDKAMLATLAEQATSAGPGSAEAAQRLADATALVKAKTEALTKDPGLWVQQNSPVVSDAFDQWTSATDPKDQALAFNVYAATTIAEQKRQGVLDPQILSADAATRLGQTLNPKPGQSAEQSVAAIRQMEAQFGPYVPQVFGQISKDMSDGARTVAVMAPSQDLAAGRLIEANQNKDTIEKATGGTVGTQIKDAVTAEFSSFIGTFSHDAAGYAEGLKYQGQAELLTRLYVTQGATPEAAAERVRKEIIDPIYDTSIGVRVPPTFDPGMIERGASFIATDLTDEGLDVPLDDTGAGADAANQYARSISANHTWVNSPDGQGLVMLDEHGRPVLKGGKPFQMNFDELQKIGENEPVDPQQVKPMDGSYLGGTPRQPQEVPAGDTKPAGHTGGRGRSRRQGARPAPPVSEPPATGDFGDTGQGSVDSAQAQADAIAAKPVNERTTAEQDFLNSIRDRFGYDPARKTSTRGGDKAYPPNHRRLNP